MSEGKTKTGFSFAEIFVMGSIFGLLCLVTIPNYLQRRSEVEARELAEAFRSYSEAFQAYRNEHGTWPPDQEAAKVPSGMETLLSGFTQEATSGGSWDWQSPNPYSRPRLYLTGSRASTRVLQQMDKILDDGDLTQGKIYKDGNSIVLEMQ